MAQATCVSVMPSRTALVKLDRLLQNLTITPPWLLARSHRTLLLRGQSEAEIPEDARVIA